MEKDASKKSGGGGVIAVVIVLLVLGGILVAVLVSANIGNLSKGSATCDELAYLEDGQYEILSLKSSGRSSNKRPCYDVEIVIDGEVEEMQQGWFDSPLTPGEYEKSGDNWNIVNL